MQRHSLIVNTAWKTANAIFSNGCYEESKIGGWRQLDQVWYSVLSGYRIFIVSRVCCSTQFDKTLIWNAAFFADETFLLHNGFLSQLENCRDIHYTQMNDILIMIRGLRFHHNLMWEIWTGGLLATTCHYSYVFLSYHCAKRLAVGEGLEKASEREKKRWRGGLRSVFSERDKREMLNLS